MTTNDWAILILERVRTMATANREGDGLTDAQQIERVAADVRRIQADAFEDAARLVREQGYGKPATYDLAMHRLADLIEARAAAVRGGGG